MNNFTPKYIKMASQYLQESLENVQNREKEKEMKDLPLKQKKSMYKNFIDWIVKH